MIFDQLKSKLDLCCLNYNLKERERISIITNIIPPVVMFYNENNAVYVSPDFIDYVIGNPTFENQYEEFKYTFFDVDGDWRYTEFNEDEEVDIGEGYTHMYVYSLSNNNTSFIMYIATTEEMNEEVPVTVEEVEEVKSLSNDLLHDVEVNVKVLVGSQVVSLDFINQLKSGDVIELEQYANDPLTLVVNNVPYAKGEIVMVDGSYGIQITKMLTKEDVYHV